MESKNVKISSNFKKMALKAIFAISLFILTYLLLMSLSIGLTILSAYLGLLLIESHPSFITLALGAGLISMGVLILIFLVKFIFKEHKADRSHLIEINAVQEPELFECINEIVKEVKTGFPKKVYLSAEVNAAVFYDSSFWSMIFPVKKNLQIGLGLLNSVTAVELKAILAHEFGHFSQRSMKVGSYVHNVNRIIYNMLYENSSFESLVQSWSSVSAYISFFVLFSVKIVHGIQWVLRKVYQEVNISYMALSREMEFHADAVAANVVGTEPLVSALLRMDLADHSYNETLNYYGTKIADNFSTKNIFPQHQFVLNFLGDKNKLPVKNDLPSIDLDHVNRFNKSKLKITDQWSSHPSTEERVLALKKLKIFKETNDIRSGTTLFKNITNWQKAATIKVFSTVTYKGPISYIEDEQFFKEYAQTYGENSFDEIFNCYYDNRNPPQIDSAAITIENENIESNINSLFNSSTLDFVYTSLSLQRDIATLLQISENNSEIKSFDYAGTRYSSNKAKGLVPALEKELNILKEKLEQNDICIYKYFLNLACKQNKEQEYLIKHKEFLKIDAGFTVNSESYMKILNASAFINETNTYDTIEKKMFILKESESIFKKDVERIFNDEAYRAEMTLDMKELFANYLSKDWIYFDRPDYNNDALSILFNCINNYQTVLSKRYFKVKKELLHYQVTLEKALSLA